MSRTNLISRTLNCAPTHVKHVLALQYSRGLKMGLHDTFDFDEAAYRAKCAERPTSKLQQEEVRKLRQHFAASASMAIGLSHAVQVGSQYLRPRRAGQRGPPTDGLAD